MVGNNCSVVRGTVTGMRKSGLAETISHLLGAGRTSEDVIRAGSSRWRRVRATPDERNKCCMHCMWEVTEVLTKERAQPSAQSRIPLSRDS